MPALGSSVINKSGKKFAPKAPLRRPIAVTSTEQSTRSSVEPPSTSQTPQPQIVQQSIRSPSPAPPPHTTVNASVQNPDISLSRDNDASRQGNSQNGYDERNRHDLKRKVGGVSHESQRRSQPTTTPKDSGSKNVTPSSDGRQSAPPAIQSSQISTSNPIDQTRNESSPRLSPHLSAPETVRRTLNESIHEDAPATKRRKTTSIHANAQPRQQPDTQDQAPIQPSSTEAISNTVTFSVPTRASARKASTLPSKAVAKPLAKRNGKQRDQPASADISMNSPRTPTRRTQNAQTSKRVKKPRQATKTKRKQALQNAAADIVADAAEGTTNRRKGRQGRKERELTPEEAENETIVPEQIRMADLCKDTRKGKKSDMLKALQERDREELVKKAQKELQQLVGNEAPVENEQRDGAAGSATEGGNANGPAAGEIERRQELSRQVAGTYVNENGEIMIDTASLQVDRHAQAAAEREQGQLEAIEENYLSKPAVNSRTYAKRVMKNSWPEDLTDEFYEALRMFGTDFDMIGRMLRKTRRAIKLKFTREEKSDPDRINQALYGERIAVDVEDFSRRAGEELKETEEHERMMEEDRKQIEESAADELRAKEEQEQIRKDQAEQERAAAPDDSSGKENRESGKKKEKRKKGSKEGAKEKGKKDGAKQKGMKEGATEKSSKTGAKDKSRKKKGKSTEQVS
ncbi:MAG: hypothetical protein Q9209_002255 [Squamulea sp. 1 TL-2023]